MISARQAFWKGTLIIPEFVLAELQHIADSEDALRRAKGRRGLDILQKMQNELGETGLHVEVRHLKRRKKNRLTQLYCGWQKKRAVKY